jgi:hypothetical protein
MSVVTVCTVQSCAVTLTGTTSLLRGEGSGGGATEFQVGSAQPPPGTQVHAAPDGSRSGGAEASHGYGCVPEMYAHFMR